MIYQSLRPRQDILSNTIGKPKSLSLDNYIKLITKDHFFRYFGNSVMILVVSLALLVFISSITAYGIARYQFKGRKFFRIYFLIGLMFPIQLGIVPVFQIMKQLNLINNPLAVILVSAANISMPVFMLTDFFAKLPKEIYEAAVIDGAGEWLAFRKIMFPMAQSGIVTVTIFNFINIWNEYFLSLIFASSDKLKPVAPGLYGMINSMKYTGDWAGMFAAVIIVFLPTFILYIFLSEKIIGGVTGGIKG